MRQQIHVRAVRGRYPGHRAFHADNINATVTELARLYRIRIDDDAHPEMWLELTLEIDIASGAQDDDADHGADDDEIILGEQLDDIFGDDCNP